MRTSVRFPQRGWLSTSSLAPPCRWPPTATIRPAAGIVNVRERRCVPLPPPGTVHIGSGEHGITLSQYGLTGIVGRGSTVTRYST